MAAVLGWVLCAATMAALLSPTGPIVPLIVLAVVHPDGDIALLEASLGDSNDAIIATATAIARVIPLSQAEAAV